jgi:SAM-dependent methyltransferase
LREDFCGTSLLACEFVKGNRENHAIGIDLDRKTLDWGRKHYVPVLGKDVDRLTLIEGDVLDSGHPEADLVAALNFSYGVFKTREQLGKYFSSVREAMAPGGIFVIDSFGGTEAMAEDKEDRQIPTSKGFDGTKVPRFTYVWDQAAFNPVDHEILCYIHFKLRDGSRIRRAFTYRWRLWTLPELQELMIEAGFATTEVYVEGWDEEEDDTDGIFRRRKRFENQSGWVAYVVGLI